MATARDEILDKLRLNRIDIPDKPDFTAPVFDIPESQLEQAFKKALEQVNGNVWLCESENELLKNLKDLLSRFSTENISCHEPGIQIILDQICSGYSTSSNLSEHIETGITGCEFLIAHTGSVMVSSAQGTGRQLFVYPPVHIVLAKKEQLVPDLESAYKSVMAKYADKKPSQISLITGPSRTADIEKTLTLGAHGPKELHVLIY